MHNLALESSPLYEPGAELAREGFSGTVAELYARLNCMLSENMRRSVRWPKTPSALGSVLRRMASNLRAVGIDIEFSRADIRGRHVVFLISASEPGKDRQLLSVTIGSLGSTTSGEPTSGALWPVFQRKRWKGFRGPAMVVRHCYH